LSTPFERLSRIEESFGLAFGEDNITEEDVSDLASSACASENVFVCDMFRGIKDGLSSTDLDVNFG